MKAHLIRTSRRSRLENWSMRHKVLIMISMLAATAAVSLGAGAAAVQPQPRRTQRRAWEQSLSQLVAAGAPGATLLVRRGDRTTLLARGFADTATKKRMRPGDSFRIGSLTKTYVATVLLQLAEEGRLSLDDPVTRFLPGLVPGGDKITIRQLLNQTSGLFDYEKDPRVLAPYLAGNLAYRWAPRKLVRIAVSHRPLFTPGTRWSYSNTNYILAGLIVEAATGATLGQVLDRRLFRPLRLRHTAFQTSPRMPVPDAHGYYVFDKPPATDITGLTPYPWAAGAARRERRGRRELLPRLALRAAAQRRFPPCAQDHRDPRQGSRDGRPLRARHRTARDALRYRLGPRRQHARLQGLRPLQHERTQAGRALHQPGPELHAQAPRADVRPATDRCLLQSIDLPRIDEGVGPSGAASRHPSSLTERRRSRTYPA